MKNKFRIILGGLSAGLSMITISSFIHGFVFNNIWKKVDFLRPIDEWPFIPGAAIITILWNIGLSFIFYRLYSILPGKGFKKGINFGLIIFTVFIPFVELWCYIQFDMPFMAAVAGMLCYLIVLPLGGIIMNAILGKRLK